MAGNSMYNVGTLVFHDAHNGEGAYFVDALHRGERQCYRITHTHVVQTHTCQSAFLDGDFTRLFRHASFDEAAMQEGGSGIIIITNRG